LNRIGVVFFPLRDRRHTFDFKMFIVRPGNDPDAHALGSLVQESILSAPSSVWEWDELAQDPARIGRALIGQGESDVLFCHVAEASGLIVGVAQVLKGEFIRCQHSLMGLLLVRPSARRFGVGRSLIRSMKATSTAHLSPEGGKLTMRVSARDEALDGLLRSEGWVIEQEVEAGLQIGDVPVVVRVVVTGV